MQPSVLASPTITSDRTPQPFAGESATPLCAQVVLTFDVEEHHRIEAAAGIEIDPASKAHHDSRVEPATHWVLEQLAKTSIQATFFIVGEYAKSNPSLIRAIHREGHEIASHGWDHRRVLAMSPAEFRQDVRQSKDALEQLTGEAVVGYRAPTFSIMRQTAWALDVLTEEGMQYDSSIYPVRHDRYGVPAAPRQPFLAHGERHAILELPPATLRFLGMNAPMGGGGYFRLFPLLFTKWAIRQMHRLSEKGSDPERKGGQTPFRTAVAMLYFHPWEFDPNQPRLPLALLNKFRTYVGIGRNQRRLASLLGKYQFLRAIEVAETLSRQSSELMRFYVSSPG